MLLCSVTYSIHKYDPYTVTYTVHFTKLDEVTLERALRSELSAQFHIG